MVSSLGINSGLLVNLVHILLSTAPRVAKNSNTCGPRGSCSWNKTKFHHRLRIAEVSLVNSCPRFSFFHWLWVREQAKSSGRLWCSVCFAPAFFQHWSKQIPCYLSSHFPLVKTQYLPFPLYKRFSLFIFCSVCLVCKCKCRFLFMLVCRVFHISVIWEMAKGMFDL